GGELFNPGVQSAYDAGSGALGDQGGQLGADPAAWVDHLRDADAVRVRLSRTIHNRRAHRGVSGIDGDGHPFDRDLLSGRALSLCDGGRDADGVSGWTAFLVAQADRADVSGWPGTVGCGGDVRGVQSDISAAVCARLSGDAAAV